MKKLKNITVALFISAMSVCSLSVYASPARDNISISAPSQPTVSASAGTVTLTVTSHESVTFQIYSITGQVVKNITISQGSATVELPKGYYIVRCNHWSKSVVVK